MYQTGVQHVRNSDLKFNGQNHGTVNILSSSTFNCTAQIGQRGRRNSSQKSPSTIWREQSASLSRRNRADLEKSGSVLICNLAALTRVNGCKGPGISRVAKGGDTQVERSPKSRHQSNRLLRREREQLVRDSVRE